MDHDPEYGEISRAAYRKGCRCTGCTLANTEYVREWRAVYVAEGRTPPRIPQPRTALVSVPAAQQGSAAARWSGVPLWGAVTAVATWQTDSPGECPQCGVPLAWSRGMTVHLCPGCGYFASPVKSPLALVAEETETVSLRGIATREKARMLAAHKGEARAMLTAQLQRFAVNSADYQAYVLTGIARVREVLSGYASYIGSAQTLAEVDQLVREIADYVNSETGVLAAIETGRYQPQPGANFGDLPRLAALPPVPVPSQHFNRSIIQPKASSPEPITGKCEIPQKHFIKPPAVAWLHMSQGPAFDDYLVCDNCLHMAESVTKELGFTDFKVER